MLKMFQIGRRKSWEYYAAILAIGVIFFLLALWMPTESFLRNLFAIPGVAALVAIPLQIVLAYNNYLRQLDLQNRRQDFDLAIASQMASRVFEKHATFCEKYMERILLGLETFLHSSLDGGPSKTAEDLARIRLEHITWLTGDIDLQLVDVENFFRASGANQRQLDHLPVGPERTKVVAELYKSFGILMELSKTSTDTGEKNVLSEQKTITEILNLMRSILDITELTTLRKEAVRGALSRLRS